MKKKKKKKETFKEKIKKEPRCSEKGPRSERKIKYMRSIRGVRYYLLLEAL